jgi:hypothetical protein
VGLRASSALCSIITEEKYILTKSRVRVLTGCVNVCVCVCVCVCEREREREREREPTPALAHLVTEAGFKLEILLFQFPSDRITDTMSGFD